MLRPPRASLCEIIATQGAALLFPLNRTWLELRAVQSHHRHLPREHLAPEWARVQTWAQSLDVSSSVLYCNTCLLLWTHSWVLPFVIQGPSCFELFSSALLWGLDDHHHQETRNNDMGPEYIQQAEGTFLIQSVYVCGINDEPNWLDYGVSGR